MKKNFVFGMVLIRKLNITERNMATVENENTVHQRDNEANRNIIGKIKMGKIVSKATCFAPPIHGTLNLSLIVLNSPDLLCSGTCRPFIKLKLKYIF